MALTRTTPAIIECMDWVAHRLNTVGYFLREDLCAGTERDMSTASTAITFYRKENPDKITHTLATLDDGVFTKAGRKHGGQWYFVRPDLVP